MKVKFIMVFFIFIILILLFTFFSRSRKVLDNKYNFIHIPKNAGSSIKKLIQNSDIPINYIDHRYPKKSKNEIVILRDPIDRFISAFYYSKQKWPNKFNKKFNNPNDFVQALKDSKNKKHKIAQSIISNEKEIFKIRNSNKTIKLNDVNHTVLGKPTPYIWTYMPQSTWLVNNPKYILRYNFLEKDFNKFLKSINYNKYIKLPNVNKSIHRNTYLSDDSKEFLYKFYDSDYKLLRKHKLY